MTIVWNLFKSSDAHSNTTIWNLHFKYRVDTNKYFDVTWKYLLKKSSTLVCQSLVFRSKYRLELKLYFVIV